MKLLSLFSGIGAFEKALTNLGIHYELAAFCEIDQYAAKSYCAIHGADPALNLGDITQVDETKLPKGIDLLTYGFPCTDISIAGKQQGLFHADGTLTRSGLFFDALRIIRATQPRVAIAENVKNLLSDKFSGQFQLVLDALDAAGYRNYYQILNSKHYDAPQNRERVFIVSVRKDIDPGNFTFPQGVPLTRCLRDVLEPEVDEKFFVSEVALKGLIEHRNRNAAKGNGFGFNLAQLDEIAPTIRARYYKDGSECLVAIPEVLQIGNCCPTKTRDNPNQGRIYDTAGISPSLNCMGGGNRQPFVVIGDPAQRIRRLTPLECFRLMGFDDASFMRAAQVNSNTQLYKQAGNSIVVQVLEALLTSVMACGILPTN